MQTEVVFLGHIVGRTGLACDPVKLVVFWNWYAPDKVKGVRQFVGFVGYYRRFVKDSGCGVPECTTRTTGGPDTERGPICVDGPTTDRF